MVSSSLTNARRLLGAGANELLAAAGSGASEDDLLAVLVVAEEITRRLEQAVVAAVAGAERRGVFAGRGYQSTLGALGDLLGWERPVARPMVVAAEQVSPRTGLDGTVLAPRLPATAAVFTAGRTTVRHVEMVAWVLGTRAAERLTPQVWAGAEAQLADKAADYTPTELLAWGTALVEALDQDGAEPDDRPPPQVNELHLVRHRGRGGGKLVGRFDDAAMFDAIAVVVDAKAKPTTAEDQRSSAERQAEALAEVCGHVLDHGNLPHAGGRPHLNVLVRLEDLENRARAACLDFGGTLAPESLRMLACDAAVVPIVLGGKGQPLDVGRVTRTIPDGLRRAVAARGGGCEFPGCDRPPSWCEVHHVVAWQDGGPTALHNCVMLCRVHHRLLHHSDWIVRIGDGLPEFVPPAWIDVRRRPRRRSPPQLVAS